VTPEWPGFDRPTIRLAEAYAACGSRDDALMVLATCEADDAEHSAALFLLGHHAARVADWELALHQWGAAARILDLDRARDDAATSAVRAAIVSNLGVSYWMLGDPRSAQDCWVKVLSGAPPSPEPMTNLGLLHLAFDRPIEARQTLEAALRHARAWAPGLVNFGISLACGGAFDEAERCFVRAVSASDGRSEPRKNLANLYRQKGQESEAAVCWNRSLRDEDGPHVNILGWCGMLAMVEHPGRAYRPFHDPDPGQVVYDLDAIAPDDPGFDVL
jgi:Flp pilus assembly protein TadD